ncbi:MAG TPA: hypothetical protein VHZ95_05600, partial [Polyangiales bacterium]|nr:hypothetical protein [Polyangiales bacterium]
MLDAKLQSALTLHVDAADAEGDYGVMRALTAQLLESAFETTTTAAAPHLEWLTHALPALAPQPRVANDNELDPNRVRARVMTALKEWILAIANERPLLIAVDDVHAIDEPSAAALALLTHGIAKERLIVVATVETAAIATAPSALKVFADAATTLRLKNLDPSHTEALLRSVFGDVPHVQMVAHKLHAITEGNPRDVMLLAQFLVDRRLATYQSGAWSLPASIDPANLPSSMAQALRVRVEALAETARELGQFMTLSDRGLSFDECVSLCSARDAGAVSDAIDELLRGQIVLRLADVHTIAQRGFVVALQDGLDDAKRREIHEALAELFRRRGDEEFRRAQHLFRANQDERALDVLLDYASRSLALTDEAAEEYFKLTRMLPEDWFECFQLGLRACETYARPRKQSYVLQARLIGLVDVMNVPGSLGYRSLHDLLRLLSTECGLADYEALDPTLDSMARLKIGIEAAQARYNERTDHDRVFEPLTTIRYLVRAAIASIGLAAKNIDHSLWRSIPSLEPLVPLSPAIALVHGLAVGVGARTTAQMESARTTYKRLVELTNDAASTGLGESNHRFLRYGVMFGLGTIEACMGLSSSLEWANAIETEPTHQVNAQLVRLLYHLWQGEVREADKYKEQIELLRIRN